MTVVRQLFVLTVLVFLAAAGSAFASATQAYLTPGGTATGSCPAGTATAPNFAPGSSTGQINNAASWGSGAGQIGPGTTLLVCGTFTNSTQGGNLITVQNSGTSTAPIVILFDTAGASLNSTGWWGSMPEGCAPCAGAITINGYSYITINGQSTGIIQNMLAGTSGNTCAGGTCTQSPGGSGTTGIAVVNAANILIENLTIRNMYANAGASSSATDIGGQFSTNISVYASSPITVVNNTLTNASIGIAASQQGQSGETGGTSSCPTVLPVASPGSGVCFGYNTLSDHHWHISNGANGGVGTFNIYNNKISGFTNWQFPTSAYHTDGIITYGGANTIATNNIWNNTFTGDLGNGSATAFIYCTSDGGNDGSGSACTIFNNVFVGDTVLNSFIATQSSAGDAAGQFEKIYNNTFVNGGYDFYFFYNSGAPLHTVTMENNVMVGQSSTYFYVLNGGATFSASDNTFYGGRTDAWNGSTSLSAWQSACSCDSGSQVTNPNLTSTYSLGTAISGENLATSIGINALNFDIVGAGRPQTGTGNWSPGAYQYQGAPPPTGVTVSAVQP